MVGQLRGVSGSNLICRRSTSRCHPSVQPFQASITHSATVTAEARIAGKAVSACPLFKSRQPGRFAMLRRKLPSPVKAKVSQTESKTNNKQEDQPSPDDNFYIVVCHMHSSNANYYVCICSARKSLQCVRSYSYSTMQASVAAAMATGVANRVLYKMALVPMGNYVFVLSQFQTFGYLLVYFSILAARYK